MGSGSLNAMAVFEAGYKDDLSREEAVALVARAIRSGVYNDLGSGSNVDICVITKDGVDYQRSHEFLQAKTYARQKPQRFAPGSVRECYSLASRWRAGAGRPSLPPACLPCCRRPACPSRSASPRPATDTSLPCPRSHAMQRLPAPGSTTWQRWRWWRAQKRWRWREAAPRPPPASAPPPPVALTLSQLARCVILECKRSRNSV